jgi:hypothetical protein
MLRLSAGERKVERVELPCTLTVRESTGPARSSAGLSSPDA